MPLPVEIHRYNHIFAELIVRDTEIYNKIVRHYEYEISRFQVKSYSGRGNPKICLVKNDRFLYLGLVGDLIEFLVEQGIHYGVSDELLQRNSVDEKKFDAFIDVLNLRYPLRPYQRKAIIETYEQKSAILLSPTSSGKSLMILVLALMHLSRSDTKVCIMVPSKGLVDQMYNDFMDYTSTNTYIGIPRLVQRIHSEIKEKIESAKIVITTWQSANNKTVEFLQQFGMLIYDECHQAKANESRQLIEQCSNLEYRIGTTGTLYGDDDLSDMTLQGIFGEVVQSATARELIDMGYMAELQIYAMILRYPDLPARLEYAEEVEYFCNHQQRFNILIQTLLNFKMNSMVLFRRRDFGKMIYDRLRQSREYVFYIDGTVPSNSKNDMDRQRIRAFMEEHDNVILVASYGTCSTGYSIKNIHQVIMAESMKKRIKVLQTIGRGLRLNHNKSAVKIIDVVDRLDYDGYLNGSNYSYYHYIKRKRYYDEQQFQFKEMTHRI